MMSQSFQEERQRTLAVVDEIRSRTLSILLKVSKATRKVTTIAIGLYWEEKGDAVSVRMS